MLLELHLGVSGGRGLRLLGIRGDKTMQLLLEVGLEVLCRKARLAGKVLLRILHVMLCIR